MWKITRVLRILISIGEGQIVCKQCKDSRWWMWIKKSIRKEPTSLSNSIANSKETIR